MPIINPLDYKSADLCTIQDACALVQVSRRTIYNWLQQDRLQYCRTRGGGIRIVKASLFRDPDMDDASSHVNS